jgi:prolyl oligopeptidase
MKIEIIRSCKDIPLLMRNLVSCLALLLILGCSLPAQELPKVPESKRSGFVEQIHGQRIPDPYRWLEDQGSKETRRWIGDQTKYAEAILDRLPYQARIRRDLEPFFSAETLSVPTFAERRYYYSKKPRGAEREAIYSRSSLDGEEKLVLTPDRISGDPTITVEMRGVSAKGEYLAYAVRSGGEDEVVLRVMNLETGLDLDDVVPRAMHWHFAFNTAGDGFYYSVEDKIHGPKIFSHRLGTALKEDRVVFEAKRREYWVTVNEIDNGKKLFCSIGIGWQRQEFYIRETGGADEWKPVIKDIDAQFSPYWVDQKLWMLTDFGAPLGRVVQIDLNDTAPEKWKEVIPERRDVLQGLANVEGRLFLLYLRNGAHVILICQSDGTAIRELELPGLGQATLPRPTDRAGIVMFTYESFTQPSTIYTYNLATTERKIWHQAACPVDTSGFVVKQEWAESDDGTRHPVWIVHNKGLKLDGTHPTVLTGYGGFNWSNLPSSRALGVYNGYDAVWIKEGGVLALATLRGGSEFGRAWHKGGMLRHKQNVFDDFLSAAEYLCRHGYTCPSKLAIKGISNGGLLMGAALTQRPDLFRAVVALFPEFDLIGFPRYAMINPPALFEYGDASNPGEFRDIIRWSPYQNIKAGCSYPAVLVQSGDMDDRVDPVEARKMVAKLQWATTSGQPIILNYDPRAGHSGGRPSSRQLRDAVWEMAFLYWQLGMKPQN